LNLKKFGIATLGSPRCAVFLVAMAVTACSSQTTGNNRRNLDSQELSHPDFVSFFAWSPDGTKLAVSYADDTRIALWDLASKEKLWTVRKKLGVITAGKDLAFGPGGETIITGSAITIGGENTDATVSVISTSTGEILRTVRETPPPSGQNKPSSFVMSRDRTKLMTAIGTGRVAVYDTTSWKILDEIGPIIHRNVMFGGGNYPANIMRLAWDEKRGLIFAALYNAQIQTWDLASNKKTVDFQPVQVDVNDMRLDYESEDLVIGASADRVGLAPIEGGPIGLMKNFQDDPATLVQSWNGRTGKRSHLYLGLGGSVSAVDISRDGKFVAAVKSRIFASKAPAYLIVWDAKSETQLEQIELGQGIVSDLSFDPEGKRIAYSVDNIVHIINFGK
jgi:WD40 repeat protein